MKTSNILIAAVVILLFISSAATNLTLKKEFEKIDKNDPTYGFKRHDVASFSYVKLKGKAFGLTEIRYGTTSQIRSIIEEGALEWKVSNDTLVVSYKPSWEVGYADLSGKPSIYIITSKLAGVEAESIVTRIRGLKADSLRVHQSGRGMLIFESSIKNLRADVDKGGFLQLGGSNTFAKAELNVSDSSSVEIDRNVFKELKTKIDSTAQIKVPGSLIKSISMQ